MPPHGCFTWLHRLIRPAANAPEKNTVTIDRYASSDKEKNVSITEYKKEQQELAKAVESVIRKFEVDDLAVGHIFRGFLKQLNEGLRRDGSAIEQIPSYIRRLPNGTEKGTCLAVDLGGTNIRVCSVTLRGDGAYTLIQEKAAIPAQLMCGRSSELFQWIAKTVQGFLGQHFKDLLAIPQDSESATIFNLGFTFSHAVKQDGVNSGTLIRWSKGFDIQDAVGEDVCALLQDAFLKLDVPVRVSALINDTVGTLLAHAYASTTPGPTILGAVFGTGTNGAYIEKASRITKLGQSAKNGDEAMLMNTEWGNFDQDLEFLPRTEWDKIIDESSVNPGMERFEKLISGMYLGEILRLVILSIYESCSSAFLTGVVLPESSRLFRAGSLDSSFLSDLASDTTSDLAVSRAKISEWIEAEPINFETAQAIQRIANAIGRRSARLSAVAIGAVIKQTECLEKLIGEEKVNIGVDGSLIELYPNYTTEIRQTLACIEEIGKAGEAQISMELVKDGSGIGAALAAHVAAR